MKRIHISKEQLRVAVITCGMIGACLGISNNTVGVFYTSVCQELGIYRGTLALYSSIMCLAQGVSAALVHRLIYRKDFVRILRLSILVSALSTAALSQATHVSHFYILSAITGLANGLFATGTVSTIVGGWFQQNSGTAVGFVMGFSGLTCAAFTPIMSWVVQTFGWRIGYLADGACIALLSLPALLLPFRVSPGESSAGETKKADFSSWQFSYILLCVFTFGITCLAGITQHLSGYAQTIGLTELFGAGLVSCVMIANTTSKFLTGILSDRIGPILATAAMILLNISGLLLLIWGQNGQTTLLMGGAFLFGTVYGMTTVGIAILTRYFYGEENYAAAFSIVYMCNLFGAALALMLVGYVYDLTGSYIPALYGAVCIQLVNLSLLFCMHRSRQSKIKQYSKGEEL